MTNKNTLIIVAAVVVVILAVSAWFVYRSPETPRSEKETGATGTRSEVPADVVVPDVGSTNVPENVAVPQTVSPAAPNVEAKFRSFDLRVEGNKFVPDTVAVNVGDTVHINITATDKDYDFVQPEYGFRGSLPKGATKVLEFQATAEGKYTLYCEKCGGPEKGPLAYIIVVKK
jgi:heme/copper-type cytochrome/quinol oxidase subunit 2